jgi:hypothetical protein
MGMELSLQRNDCRPWPNKRSRRAKAEWTNRRRSGPGLNRIHLGRQAGDKCHEVAGGLHAADNPKAVLQRGESPRLLNTQIWLDGHLQKK